MPTEQEVGRASPKADRAAIVIFVVFMLTLMAVGVCTMKLAPSGECWHGMRIGSDTPCR